MRRWATFGAGLSVTVAFVALIVAAIFADGRPATESETNDGGAWLLNRSLGKVGHINQVVGEISTAVGPFQGRFSVDQAENIVVVHDPVNAEATLKR